MTFEYEEHDPLQEEQDLQLWAQELGLDYIFGTQGTVEQPSREMKRSRLAADIGKITARIRELSGLPSIISDEERALHVSPSELRAMTLAERDKWHIDVLGWLIDNPSATIHDLIDLDIKKPKSD